MAMMELTHHTITEDGDSVNNNDDDYKYKNKKRNRHETNDEIYNNPDNNVYENEIIYNVNSLKRIIPAFKNNIEVLPDDEEIVSVYDAFFIVIVADTYNDFASNDMLNYGNEWM